MSDNEDEQGVLHPLSSNLTTVAKMYPRQHGTRYLQTVLNRKEDEKQEESGKSQRSRSYISGKTIQENPLQRHTYRSLRSDSSKETMQQRHASTTKGLREKTSQKYVLQMKERIGMQRGMPHSERTKDSNVLQSIMSQTRQSRDAASRKPPERAIQHGRSPGPHIRVDSHAKRLTKGREAVKNRFSSERSTTQRVPPQGRGVTESQEAQSHTSSRNTLQRKMLETKGGSAENMQQTRIYERGTSRKRRSSHPTDMSQSKELSERMKHSSVSRERQEYNIGHRRRDPQKQTIQTSSPNQMSERHISQKQIVQQKREDKQMPRHRVESVDALQRKLSQKRIQQKVVSQDRHSVDTTRRSYASEWVATQPKYQTRSKSTSDQIESSKRFRDTTKRVPLSKYSSKSSASCRSSPIQTVENGVTSCEFQIGGSATITIKITQFCSEHDTKDMGAEEPLSSSSGAFLEGKRVYDEDDQPSKREEKHYRGDPRRTQIRRTKQREVKPVVRRPTQELSTEAVEEGMDRKETLVTLKKKRQEPESSGEGKEQRERHDMKRKLVQQEYDARISRKRIAPENVEYTKMKHEKHSESSEGLYVRPDVEYTMIQQEYIDELPKQQYVPRHVEYAEEYDDGIKLTEERQAYVEHTMAKQEDSTKSPTQKLVPKGVQYTAAKQKYGAELTKETFAPAVAEYITVKQEDSAKLRKQRFIPRNEEYTRVVEEDSTELLKQRLVPADAEYTEAKQKGNVKISKQRFIPSDAEHTKIKQEDKTKLPKQKPVLADAEYRKVTQEDSDKLPKQKLAPKSGTKPPQKATMKPDKKPEKSEKKHKKNSDLGDKALDGISDVLKAKKLLEKSLDSDEKSDKSVSAESEDVTTVEEKGKSFGKGEEEDFDEAEEEDNTLADQKQAIEGKVEVTLISNEDASNEEQHASEQTGEADVGEKAADDLENDKSVEETAAGLMDDDAPDKEGQVVEQKEQTTAGKEDDGVSDKEEQAVNPKGESVVGEKAEDNLEEEKGAKKTLETDNQEEKPALQQNEETVAAAKTEDALDKDGQAVEEKEDTTASKETEGVSDNEGEAVKQTGEVTPSKDVEEASTEEIQDPDQKEKSIHSKESDVAPEEEEHTVTEKGENSVSKVAEEVSTEKEQTPDQEETTSLENAEGSADKEEQVVPQNGEAAVNKQDEEAPDEKEQAVIQNEEATADKQAEEAPDMEEQVVTQNEEAAANKKAEEAMDKEEHTVAKNGEAAGNKQVEEATDKEEQAGTQNEEAAANIHAEKALDKEKEVVGQDEDVDKGADQGEKKEVSTNNKGEAIVGENAKDSNETKGSEAPDQDVVNQDTDNNAFSTKPEQKNESENLESEVGGKEDEGGNKNEAKDVIQNNSEVEDEHTSTEADFYEEDEEEEIEGDEE